ASFDAQQRHELVQREVVQLQRQRPRCNAQRSRVEPADRDLERAVGPGARREALQRELIARVRLGAPERQTRNEIEKGGCERGGHGGSWQRTNLTHNAAPVGRRRVAAAVQSVISKLRLSTVSAPWRTTYSPRYRPLVQPMEGRRTPANTMFWAWSRDR